MCFAYTYLCTVHACLVPTEDKEDIGSHGNGVMDLRKPHMDAENRTWSSGPRV